MRPTYIGISQHVPLRIDEVNDSVNCSRKRDATTKKSKQHDVWEESREVRHLEIKGSGMTCVHDSDFSIWIYISISAYPTN